MTFVGKILVIVIMVFALLFLGISTMVFVTETNWKDATAKEKTKVSELTKKISDAGEAVKAAEIQLKTAKETHTTEVKRLTDTVAAREEEIKRAQNEITQVRTALETAQQSARTALDEAAARKGETDQLRAQKSAVEKQANEFKVRQTELNDKIREQQRMLETASRNLKDLRDSVARFSALLRKNGLSDDITHVVALETPPPVEGEISRIDPKSKRIEFTLDSDDGIVVGHELYIYRLKPRPEYLGKLRVIAVDPDQSVGQIIGNTVHGKKLQEGDIVSSTVRPRS